jgi:hypothetical protein
LKYPRKIVGFFSPSPRVFASVFSAGALFASVLFASVFAGVLFASVFSAKSFVFTHNNIVLYYYAEYIYWCNIWVFGVYIVKLYSLAQRRPRRVGFIYW